MDDTRIDPDGSPTTRAGMGRRAFFGRSLLAVGAATALFGLTGCPGGNGEDEGGDDDADDGGDDD
jgi:hypothetical protein